MKPSERRSVLEFQTKSTTTDENHQPTIVWSKSFSARGNISGGGQQFNKFANGEPRQTHTITMMYRDVTITNDMRIRCDGINYKIIGRPVVDVEHRKKYMTIPVEQEREVI